jgi:phosphohistidine phosphatase
MNVYLLRHAIAGERDSQKYANDEERPLTAEGIEKMRVAAEGIARILERPDSILTSPLVRTVQTANIVAKALGCKDRIETSDALRPGATAAKLRSLLARRAESRMLHIMVVGHEPDLGQIASQMIGASGPVVEFKKGALCAIRLEDSHLDQGTLLWHVAPKHLRAMAE